MSSVEVCNPLSTSHPVENSGGVIVAPGRDHLSSTKTTSNLFETKNGRSSPNKEIELVRKPEVREVFRDSYVGNAREKQGEVSSHVMHPGGRAAGVYPQLHHVTQQPRVPTHQGLYGLSPHLIPPPQHVPIDPHSVHSPRHRHLMHAHALLNPQYAPAVNLSIWPHKHPHLVNSQFMVQGVSEEVLLQQERERAIIEKQCILHTDRDKKDEKDRLGQQKNEREKHEQQRLEKERHERERQISEHITGERSNRPKVWEEKERAQREVQFHFEESLRLANNKKNLGWSHISNLPLTKHSLGHRSSPALSRAPTLTLQPVERDTEERRKDWVEIESEEKNRIAVVDGIVEVEPKHWMQHQRVLEQMQHTSQMSGPPAESFQPVVKTKIESYIQRVSSPKEEGKVSVVCTKSSSRVSPITSTVASKLEPSFNIYGYQGYQPMYLFPSQLKSREGLGSSVTERASVMPQLNYPADSRRNLSLTRSPSMSPKQQKLLQETINPKIQLPGESIKTREYFQPTPAHQNSSSPSLPGRAGTPQYQSPTQEQPQNLVKSESKQNRVTNINPQREPSPRNLAHSTPGVSRRYQPSPTPPKCSVTTYPSSLIQAGLVPNPMYSSSVSNSALKTGLYGHERSVPLVIDTSSHPSLVQNNATCAQVSGITTGIPVCKPNTNNHSLVYPNSLNSQWSQNSNIQQVSPPPQTRTNSNSLSLFPPNSFNDRVSSSLNNLSHHNRYASPTLTPPAPSPATVSTPVRPNSSPSGPVLSSNISLTDKKRKSPTENLATKRQKTKNDSESPPQLHPHFPSDSRNDDNPSPPALNMISRSPLTCEGLGVCVPQSGITLSSLVKNPQFKKENGFNVLEELDNLNTKKVQANQSVIENENSQCSTSKNTTNHPKLKKAWLQRHSENKDKMFPDEAESVVKNRGAAVLKLEDLDRTFHESSLDKLSSGQLDRTFHESSLDKLSSGQLDRTFHESSLDKLSSGQDESSDENPKEVQTAINGNQLSFENQDKLDSIEDGECIKSTSDTEQELLKQKTRISQRQGSTSRFKTRGLKRKSFRQEKTEKDQLMLTNGSTLKKVQDEHQTQNTEVGNIHRKGRKPRGRGTAPENGQPKNNNNPVKLKEKTSVTVLKKTGEPFFQNGPCGEVASKLPKCRECRMTPHQRSKKMPNNFCRFFAFRKLRYSKTGTLVSSGFSEPSDATEEDLRLWMPSPQNALDQLDIKTARLLLEYVGNQFCYLVKQEKEAQALHMNQDKTVTWKRMVQNVREMCDICEATLFNIHWVCHKCGFVVCIDCYRARKDGLKKEDDFPLKDRDECQWLLCNNRQPHDQEKLMLTQIIPGTALWDMGNMLQAACNRTMFLSSERKSNNGICKLISAVNMHICDKEVSPIGHNSTSESTQFSRKNGLSDPVKGEELGGYTSDSEGSPLSWLADVALGKSSRQSPRSGTEAECETTDVEEGKETTNGCEERSGNRSTLRELLIRPNEKGVGGSSTEDNEEHLKENTVESVTQVTEPEVKKEQLQFSCSSLDVPKPQRTLSIQSRNLTESSLLHPDIPHSWLCGGKLLRLHDSQLHQNIHIFQEQWKRGQPVMVSNITSRIDTKLWNPDSFGQEFGGVKTEFVDCNTGRILLNQSLRKFWDGFENVSKRLKSKNGEEMVLKLKDWPPGENFRENLPLRHKDLIKVLPLPEYTQPGGIFNLVDRLPDEFIQPDVGLKMCSAYGSTHYSTNGTSNIHLDVCDIVNIMMYSSNGEEKTQDVLKAMEEGGCDEGILCRVHNGDIKPGAIWHIYSDEEADKIREFLNKVAKEQGEKVDSHHDPLLEQNWYLNGMLRKRLYSEYGVEGYTVVQCVGDAMFIPAGSPHQVQNLYSSITVIEDFISPESLARCFYLTQELRNSPEISTYQEDRLQIKNVIYHTVKDALSALQAGEET
ncbi:uncharacterized protein LOC143257296 isoform X2 [Tachypleus tridentatus]|uniref:uncharacterized protein LOC143257296 isoform X2 n=1 Tax=Tachypleus tridentatus TaxID=6853 RepID=UPI003FD1F790